MVTTRPMIRLSGFSRKTSFDGPCLSSSSGACSSFNCPKRGSQQHLAKCDCDCGAAKSLFRQQLLHQQQLLQQQQQRNHNVLIVQLQAQKNKKIPKQRQHLSQKRPIYVPSTHHPPPPPTFRPTISDSNSESDREGLEHFHRHLQQLHKLTCASLENAVYFGGDDAKEGKSNESTKVKSTKSFSFKDIRDIGKKKNKVTAPNVAPLNQQQASSSTASSSLSSSPISGQQSSSSSSLSKLPLKRRNTTRTAKDYIGVSRVKLLAKYWNRGKSSATDSGNGSSTSSSDSHSGTNTRPNSESGDSQLSNYSSGVTTPNKSGTVANTTKITPKTLNGSASTSTPSSNSHRAIVSPPSGHKRYPINKNNTSGGNNTVTYKVRYDIPSSWESEQLLSFASDDPTTSRSKPRGDQKHDIKHTNKGADTHSSLTCVSASDRSSVTSTNDKLPLTRTNFIREKDGKICTHCGRGPDADGSSRNTSLTVTSSIAPSGNSLDRKQVASPKPKKTLFKNLTFVRSQSVKPKEYSTPTDTRDKDSQKNGKVKDNKTSLANKTQSLAGAQSTSSIHASFACEKTMVEQKLAALGRSKSQKCPDRQTHFVSQSPNINRTKLTHTNSVRVLPKNDVAISKCFISPKSPNQFFPGGSAINLSILGHQPNQTPQPKVRFKEHRPQHHRSDQCLSYTSRSQHENKSTEKLNTLGKRTRKASPTDTPVSKPISSSSETSHLTTNKMLPDEREYNSLYDCRIPRPKLRGIVPTHSYGVGSGPSSPVSRCCSVLSENRVRRHAGDFVEFTEISLQDDDSETSGFESEQNNKAVTTMTAAATTISKGSL